MGREWLAQDTKGVWDNGTTLWLRIGTRVWAAGKRLVVGVVPVK